MLQQTQVKTVVPYWERWMQALPTVVHLAKASPEKLHKLWEGLGYYSRVRNMQKAAQIIAREHGGQLPDALEKLLALPGIGRYTAGAICSIAFNKPAPIVDGNVTRVLSRVFAIQGNPRDKATSARLWRLAEMLVECASRQAGRSRPCSLFNQALMELGATVCTPRHPRCDCCPIARLCRARAEDRVSELPCAPPRQKSTRRHFATFIVECGGRFLVRQRPPGVVNGHLWEFPNTETNGNQRLAHIARKATGLKAGKLQHVCTINHTITRYRLTTNVFRMLPPKPAPMTANSGKWLSLDSLKRLPFSSAHKKILAHLPTD
jgi:A/G-specific adenine glycosylase